LEEIAKNAKWLSTDEMMTQISRRMEKFKFQCFGKVTKKNNPITSDKELSKLYDEKAEKAENEKESEAIEAKINSKIIEYQLKDYEKKLKYLDKVKKEKGKSAAIFKLKEKIVGAKKQTQEAVTMKDPESGELIVENDELKKASVDYVSKLLTNRSPKVEFKDDFYLMESLQNI
jgi:CRISPR/Cas system-associated protein Csx1